TFTGTSAPVERTRPVSPFNLLTVKILRLRNVRKADLRKYFNCYHIFPIISYFVNIIVLKLCGNTEIYCYKFVKLLVFKTCPFVEALHLQLHLQRHIITVHLFCYTVTLSDCYVTLWLPTASSEKVRTRTIRDSKNPVWNEAFCYKIDRRVKNVLELKVCDEDTITRDDELCTVLFDIDKLSVGRTIRVKFQLNPQAREELEVEFTLQNTYPELRRCISNLEE
ncbi:hypothetical protein ASZ78_001950, partial [Callipepla squamata]